MKRTNYIALPALALLLTTAACSEKEEMAAEERISIEGIALSLEGMESSVETSSTRATKEGFSVNRSDHDPTMASLSDRGNGNWKMDFTLYNGNNKYEDGSFTEATFTGAKWSVPEDKYFPNYRKPAAEALLYHQDWTPGSFTIAKDQNTGALLLAQDVLIKEKGAIEVAHIPTVTLNHKHSMLNFVIKDVVTTDISSVMVELGDTRYTPHKTSASTDSKLEYMLILPETTSTNPVIIITTKGSENQASITYRQTIRIINNSNPKLGGNSCYCFSLQGAELKISPVTILNWATGKSLPGEYIAVTAYPTFKAGGQANQTYYFYYDNKLTENDSFKLQEIKFNKNAECTIKPDGRIITHILKDNIEPTDKNKLGSPITLGQMVIDLTSIINNLP